MTKNDLVKCMKELHEMLYDQITANAEDVPKEYLEYLCRVQEAGLCCFPNGKYTIYLAKKKASENKRQVITAQPFRHRTGWTHTKLGD